MKRIIAFLVITMSVFSACKSHPEGYFKSSNLPGMIYDADNRPCEKVLITIWYIDDSGEEEIIQIKSDINGRFTIPRLKWGSYRILAEKEGYESINADIFYSSRLDVLYLKILSQKYILSKATESLKERRFGKVDEYLIRAGLINPSDPHYLYLKSIFFYEKEQFAKTLHQLNQIVELGYHFPYVHLLMADIYQYKQGLPLEALRELKEYMNLFDDSEMSLRLKELEKLEI